MKSTPFPGKKTMNGWRTMKKHYCDGNQLLEYSFLQTKKMIKWECRRM